MRNYIEFYFNEDDKFVADIHKQGKLRRVRKEKSMLKLLNISAKYGHHVRGEGYIKEDVMQITKEFDRYMNRKAALHVIGKIASKMKISRKNVTLKKTLVVASLVALIAANGLAKKDEAHFEQEKYEPQVTAQAVTQNNDINDILDKYDIEIPEEEASVEEIQEDIQEEAKEIKEEAKEDKSELNSMFQEDSFHYSYEDRSNATNVANAKRYEDLFEKYANRYGLDKNLLIALAAQESSGEHYDNLREGKPAAGIMQIEKAVWVNSSITAYNFETGQMETVKITQDKLNDLESNIQIGSMILRYNLETNNYNIPLALQSYNFGQGNMNKVLRTCAELENIDEDSMRKNPTENAWLNYRAFLNTGDAKYVEHVFSYLGNDEIKVQKRNNETVKVALANDHVLENTNNRT